MTRGSRLCFQVTNLEYKLLTIREDISVLSQPLTISTENIRGDLQMTLCDLQSDPFLPRKIRKRIRRFQVTTGGTLFHIEKHFS